MARHTSDGSRRGLAPWVIVTAVAVLVIAGATTAYVLIVNGSDDEANAACTGQVVLPIISSAGATPAIRSAAAGFDATAPSARSTCVTTEVTEMPGDQAVQCAGIELADRARGGAERVGADLGRRPHHPGILQLRDDSRSRSRSDGRLAGRAGRT